MYEKKKTGTLKEEKGHKNQSAENSELKNLIEQYISEAMGTLKQSFEKNLETRIAAEREDAAKMASMSAEERAAAEMDKKQKCFEEERAQYVSERSEFEAAKELAAQNLPVTFAKMLADPDKDTMLTNIETFKAEYMKAIEAGLSNRLKGVPPRISKERENISDPFLNGLGI